MSALPAPVLPKVAQLVRMLASPHDGEALGACRAVGRVLQANGVSFDDLAERIEREPAPRVVYRDRPAGAKTPPPRWDSGTRPFIKVALEAAMHSGDVTDWERQFVASVLGQMAASRGWHPSPKQQARITALLAKLDLIEARS